MCATQMHMYVYITYWVCLALLACPGFSTWNWTTYMGAHPWRKLVLPTLQSHWPPVALHLGVGPCGISALCYCMSTCVIIMMILFRKPCWEFMGAFFLLCIQDPLCHSRHPGFLQPFYTLFCDFFFLLHQLCWTSLVTYLHFDQL